MPNYLFDKAYKIETEAGISANVVVVAGDEEGGCKLPSGANAGKILGVSNYSGDKDHYISVRKAGIASVRAASAVAAGDPVCVADSAGRIKKAANASGVTGVVGNNNAIRWTAKACGISGNTITVDIVAAGNNTALSVSVSGNTITINSATDGEGAAVTTATQAIAAVAANTYAAKLVEGENESTSAGSGAVADENLILSGGELGSNILGYAEEEANDEGDIIDVFLFL